MSGDHRDNPFPGPVALTSDYPIFGRDEEMIDLLGLIEAERVVVLYGLSGCGKSSLLRGRGGVCERFSEAPGHQAIGPVEFRLPRNFKGGPGTYERFLLEEILQSQDDDIAGKLPDDLDLGLCLRACANRSHCPDQLLIIDQFEDIFTRKPFDEPGREAFFSALGEAVEANPRLRVVLALREEYLGQLARYRRHVPRRLTATFRLGLLTRRNACSAILDTAFRAMPSLRLKSRDVEALVDSLSAVPAAGAEQGLIAGTYIEPLFLQLACRTAWPRAVAAAGASSECAEVAFAADHAVHNLNEILQEFYEQGIGEIVRTHPDSEARLRTFVQDALTTAAGQRPLVAAEQTEEQWGLSQEEIRALVDQHLARQHLHTSVYYLELGHDRMIAPVRASNDAWFERQPTWRRVARKAALSGTRQRLSVIALLQARRTPSARRTPLERKFLAAQFRQFRLLSLLIVAGYAAFLIFVLWTGEQARELIATLNELHQTNVELNEAGANLKSMEKRTAELEMALEQRKITIREQERLGAVNALLGRYSERKWLDRHDQAAVLQVLEGYEEAKRLYNEAVPIGLTDRFLAAFNTSMWVLPDSPGFSRATEKPESARTLALVAGRMPRIIFARGECMHIRRLDRPPKDGPCVTLPDGIPDSIVFDAGEGLLAAMHGTMAKVYELRLDDEGTAVERMAPLWDGAQGVDAIALAADGGALVYAQGTQIHTLCRNVSSQFHRCAEPLPVAGGQVRQITVSLPWGGKRSVGVASEGGGVQIVVLGSASNDASRLGLVAVEQFAPPARIHHLASSGDREVVEMGFVAIRHDDVEGPRLIAIHRDTQVFEVVRSAADGTFIQRLLTPDHGSRLRGAGPGAGIEFYRAATFAPDNVMLTVLEDDVLLWHLSRLGDVEFGSKPVEIPVIRAQTGARSLRSIVADGTFIVGEGHFSIWSWENTQDAASLLVAQAIPGPTNEVLGQAIFHPYAGLIIDDETVISGSSTYGLQRWRRSETFWRPESIAPCGEDFKRQSVRALARSPDGRLIAAAMGEQHVMVFSSALDAEPVLCDQDTHLDGLWAIAFSADGRWLASGDWKGRVVLWRIDEGSARHARTIDLGDTERVRALAFHPNEPVLAIAPDDGPLILFDVETDTTLEEMRRLALPGAEGIGVIRALDFSDDGGFLAAAGSAGPIAVWDMSSKDASAVLLSGHRGGTGALAFRPDSDKLASGGEDDLVLIWDVRHPAQRPARLSGVPSDVLHVGWSSNGERLITSHKQPVARNELEKSLRERGEPERIVHGTMLLWNWNLEVAAELACRIAWRDFSEREWDELIKPITRRDYAPSCAKH